MIPRNLWHMLGGILRRKMTPQEPGALLHYPGIWKSRATLLDCNFGKALVENAYFRNMELSIWYGCGAQGILHACARNRWYFVFGSQGLRNYKPIKLWQPYEIHTRNVYWDDSWFFLVAQFRCPDTGELFAEGLSRVMLRQGRDRVDSRLLYEEMGVHNLHDPPMPEVVEKFLLWDSATDINMKETMQINEVHAHRKRPSLLSSYSMNLPPLFTTPQAKQE